MAKKDSAPHNMSVLEQQKQQLVNAFTELAATMRRAAQEAETMAKLMADPTIPNETKAAFQQRNADFARILTNSTGIGGGGASTGSSSSLPLPPSTSFPHSHTIGGQTTNSSNGAMTSPSSEGSPTFGPATSAISATANSAVGGVPSKKRSRASEGPGLVDEDGKKKRKKREPRDPNAPKRPASAYILYQNEVRAKFREEHPELSYRELLPEIAKAWQNLDPAEKQRYQDIVDKGKAVYTVQKKAYDMAHGGSNAASPTTTTASIMPPPATTLRVPSTSAHHPSLMAPLNGGGMTPSSSHSRQSSEDEESEEEESEDDQTVHGHGRAHHGHAPVARHYQQHHQQEEDDEEEDEEEEEDVEPPMKKYKTQQLTMPPIATV